MNKTFKRLIYIIPALVAVVFCIRLIHEPDLWWQIRTGEFILENGKVPAEDVFSFTYAGKPWLNVKWGFEVIQAMLAKYLGPSFMPILQIFANLIILFFLAKNTVLLGTKKLSRALISLVLLFFLMGFSFRMNARPELVTYSFTALFLFIFLKSKENKNWLFAIIPAQLIWTNMHEAYGVGLVMSAILGLSHLVDYLQLSTKSSNARKALITTLSILIASWLVTAIHPGGLRMLWHPYEIFTQLSDNQFTQEIYSALSPEYWQYLAFIGLIMLAIALFQLYQAAKLNGKFSLKQLSKTIPLFYQILFLAFTFLAFKSYRNLPFILLISTPLVIIQINNFFGKASKKAISLITVTAGILLYVSIATNSFYKKFLPAEVYGLGVNPVKNPVGAACFIEANSLQGNAFSDYLSSSYMLWHLQPTFKTFVDLRDLDVFEAEDIEISLMLCNSPQRKLASGNTIWQEIDKRYNFQYVSVLSNREFLPLHIYLYRNKDYKLAYADELSAVYVKANTPGNQKDSFKAAATFNPPQSASNLARVFWPFYNPQNVVSYNTERAKSLYFQAIGLADK